MLSQVCRFLEPSEYISINDSGIHGRLLVKPVSLCRIADWFFRLFRIVGYLMQRPPGWVRVEVWHADPGSGERIAPNSHSA